MTKQMRSLENIDKGEIKTRTEELAMKVIYNNDILVKVFSNEETIYGVVYNIENNMQLAVTEIKPEDIIFGVKKLVQSIKAAMRVLNKVTVTSGYIRKLEAMLIKGAKFSNKLGNNKTSDYNKTKCHYQLMIRSKPIRNF